MLNQKGNLSIIIIGLCFLILTGGGFYYLITQKNNSTESLNSKAIIISTPQPTLIPTLEPEVKTLTNTNYSFSLNYPNNWIAFENDENLTDRSEFHVYFRPNSEKVDNSESWDILLQIYKTDESIDTFINTFCGYDPAPCNNKVKNLDLGSLKAKELSFPGVMTTNSVFFAQRPYIYRFNIVVGSANESLNRKIREDIISSFKYTN